MHSCPHPLWQHFWSVGQPLSLEQNSAHIPEPQFLRGHTPGFAERKNNSICKEVKKRVWKMWSLIRRDCCPAECPGLISTSVESLRGFKQTFNSCQLKKRFNSVAVLKARGTQTQHVWSARQSTWHPLFDGKTLSWQRLFLGESLWERGNRAENGSAVKSG